MNIFIVTAGWDYEGTCGQWAFTDEAAARMQFDLVAAKLRDGDEDEKGDYVTLRGPFALGENMCDYVNAKPIAHYHPAQEAAEAAHQSRLAAAKEKRRLSKARAHSEESGTLRRAEPTDV